MQIIQPNATPTIPSQYSLGSKNSKHCPHEDGNFHLWGGFTSSVIPGAVAVMRRKQTNKCSIFLLLPPFLYRWGKHWKSMATQCWKSKEKKEQAVSFVSNSQWAGSVSQIHAEWGETIQENWTQHYQRGTKACSHPLLSLSLSSSPSNSILKMQTTVKLLAQLAVMLFCMRLLSKAAAFLLAVQI